MPDQPSVILSGFGDEAANQKTAEQQFAAFAAIGLQYYSLRFIDAGNGIKNVMQLTKSEITKIRHLEDEYCLNVATLGSPIGKVKLLDQEDGTKNRYVPFKKYLADEVKRACELAHAFETKLIRGFSFYHPKGSDPWQHLPQAVDQLGRIAEMCHRSDLTFGLEVEANLVGQNGELMARLHKEIDHPALVTIFDGANISTQGYSAGEVFAQYELMKPGIGWMHIKDYRHPQRAQKTTHVDEEALKHFVPADVGDSGHDLILKNFKELIPAIEKKLKKRGIPGVFLDLEPHVKGGGQFGGFSGPDGMGVALRGLCRVLDYVGIGYHLRDFDDVRSARGFRVGQVDNLPGNSMPSNTAPAGSCPKCQGTSVACRYNFFDRGDLQVHSWEHKCPDCGWRDTHASRSDDPADKQRPQPNVCPMCSRVGQ